LRDVRFIPKTDIAEHRRHVRKGHSTIRVSGFIIFDATVREVAKGPGRSHADRGLRFGVCKGSFAPSGNLNSFYEAFMTASPILPAPSRTLYQEIFEDEHTLTTPQRTAATYASYPAIGHRPGRNFDPNNFVLCPAVGTNERDRLWIRHMRFPQNRRLSFIERKPPNGRAGPRLNHIR
jgi:hypothetical protein